MKGIEGDTAAPYLRGLLELSRLVACATDLRTLLDETAKVISEALGFHTVAVNLYRKEWDDYLVVSVYGNDDARRFLLGQTYPPSQWEPLFDKRFVRRGAYLILHDQLDWDSVELARFVPEPPETSLEPDAWDPHDSLMVPLLSSTGNVLGIISVDEPKSGLIPSDEEIDVLVAFTRHAALAIEQSQRAEAESRYRTALEELLRLSGKVSGSFSIQELLLSVCEAIRDALGFRKVGIDLLDSKMVLVNHAFVGWVGEEPFLTEPYPLEEVAGLLDPQFEHADTYLLAPEEAHLRVEPSQYAYSSQFNGRGPHAWDHHWLLTPLRDSEGEVRGLIWVDEPKDLLLPAPERRAALRMFANHASIALERVEKNEILRQNEERFRALALRDSLTGLANRLLFNDRLEHALDAGDREGRSIGLLFLDVDDFKSINDTLGHDAGDAFLIQFAQLIEELVRPGDTAARVGGDEFAILLEGCDATGAEATATRLLDALKKPCNIGDTQFVQRVSIGITAGSAEQINVDELIRQADAAMYIAKRQGKGRYVTYDAHRHAHVVERQDLKMELRNAAAREEFVLHYQPLVDLQTRNVVGVEALIRWNHPRRGLLSPAEFIAVAEESGSIIVMGEWVLWETCRQLSKWRSFGGSNGFYAAVNLSARQLLDDGLLRSIESALHFWGVSPSSLVLEFTESSMVDEMEDAVRQLRELKALGVGLAIDDFGTGYSSLAYLKRLPVDILKIDRNFVKDVATGPEGAALAKAIIHLGHSFGLTVIGEGIENSDQEGALRGMGCHAGQGYYLAMPVPAEEIGFSSLQDHDDWNVEKLRFPATRVP